MSNRYHPELNPEAICLENQAAADDGSLVLEVYNSASGQRECPVEVCTYNIYVQEHELYFTRGSACARRSNQ